MRCTRSAFLPFPCPVPDAPPSTAPNARTWESLPFVTASQGPDGGDQNGRRPAAYNPSVSLRLTAPFAQGSLFLRRRGHAARRTAMHTELCGPMWASAPTRGKPSEPGPGGHKARPYENAGSGSVGADYISARDALPRRIRSRRTHAEKPPLGDQGPAGTKIPRGGEAPG